MPNTSILARAHANARLTDGVRTWGLDELRAAVDDWIRTLDDLKLSIVAFDLPNGLEWVALDIALLESGRVAVPLPSFFTDEQRLHALQNSGAEALVLIRDCEYGAELESVGEVRSAVVKRLAAGEYGAGSDGTVPDGTALVTYTSGSTGTPKGVCLSAETLLETAQSIVEALQSVHVEKHLCVLPLTLLLENTAGLFANLLNGSEIHVPNLTSLGIRGSSELALPEFVQGIQAHAPDSVILVPALLLGLTAMAEFGMAEFCGLKFVAVGGGRVSSELLERAATQNLPVYEGYGLTECGSVVALNTPQCKRAGSVGALLPHVQAQVVNGELIVAHPTLLGVLGDTGENSDCVATGDRVELDEDGFLTVHGRIKNTFITAFGRNVSPEWVESELQTELEVAHAVVFGEAATSNTALIVPRGVVSDDDIEDAVERCNQRLPDYAQIGAWHLLTTEQLVAAGGLTSNGRVKRAVVEGAFTHLLSETTFPANSIEPGVMNS